MDSPGKKKTLLAYLQQGVAMIHLDARRSGVSVPQKFAHDAHLRLNLSYRYAIPDFDVSDERIQATLSFGGVPYQCLVPWHAIFGITSHDTGDGQVWPEDLPTEVKTPGSENETPTPVATERLATPAYGARRVRPALVALEGKQLERAPGDDAEDSASAPGEPRTDGEPPRRGHLRLVR
jgi:stringent starvation protein B